MLTQNRVFTDTQLRIFNDRYAASEEEKNLPEKMWRRVADAVAQASTPRDAESFYKILENFKFIPGGRILASAGTDAKVTSYNCFVLPSPEDSRRGIIQSLSDWVEIQSRGGGVGINMSTLRPRGAHVKGVNGTSSGPVAWMELFSTATKEVIQQGGSRRGASMLMLDDSHPDILEFITAKKTPGVLEGSNISVCISDAFMDALINNKSWDLTWGGEVHKTIDPHLIWDEIIEAAWASAEPGIYFMERANKVANSYYFEKLTATNPCAEQPLGDYSVCLLGSMNIAAYIDHSTAFDIEGFDKDVRTAVRFLDNVVELSYYPLPQCEEQQKKIRRMGIGLMGLADAFIKMGIRYGSEESIKLTQYFYEVLRSSAYLGSVELAKERGPFPAFDKEKYLKGAFIQSLPSHVKREIESHGIRNCYLTTQAPTGTTSLLAGVNSGIEPIFQYKTIRKDRTGEHVVWNELAKEMLGKNGSLPDYFVQSDDVTPIQHVQIQAAAQESIDSSISKTCNLPSNATKENVDSIYRLAYTMGLKSITVYRDGSRSEQVLYKEEPPVVISTNGHSESNGHTNGYIQVGATSPTRRRMPPERPSITHAVRIADHDLYITVGLFDDNTPGEIFIRTEKEGSTIGGLCDALAVSVSIGLQYGVPLPTLIEKMKYRNFEPAGMTNNKDIRTATSIVDYIFKWLELKYVTKGAPTAAIRSTGVLCPSCGAAAIMQDGCMECSAQCGFNKCG